MHTSLAWLKLAGFLKCKSSLPRNVAAFTCCMSQGSPWTFSSLQTVAPYSEKLFCHPQNAAASKSIRGCTKSYCISVQFWRKVNKNIQSHCTYDWQNTITQIEIQLILQWIDCTCEKRSLWSTIVLHPSNVSSAAVQKCAREVVCSHSPTLISTSAVFSPLKNSQFCLGQI